MMARVSPSSTGIFIRFEASMSFAFFEDFFGMRLVVSMNVRFVHVNYATLRLNTISHLLNINITLCDELSLLRKRQRA